MRQHELLAAECENAWRTDVRDLEELNDQYSRRLNAERKAHQATQLKLTGSQEEAAQKARALQAAEDTIRQLRLQLQREERAREIDAEERRRHLEDRARCIASLTDELNAANARAALSQEEVTDTTRQLHDSQAEVKQLQQEVSKLSRLHDCMHSDRAAAVLEQRALTEEARREVERLKGEAASSADLARRVAELQTQLHAAQEEVRAEMRRSSGGMEAVGAAKAARAAAEQAQTALQQQLQDANAKREELNCQVVRLQQEQECESKRTAQKLALAKVMLKLAQRKSSDLQQQIQALQVDSQRELEATRMEANAAASKAESRCRALFKALRFTALRFKLVGAAGLMRRAFDLWRVRSMDNALRRADVVPVLLQRKKRSEAWRKLCSVLARIVQQRSQQRALARAMAKWQRSTWQARPQQAEQASTPTDRPATPPPVPQSATQEVHHWHHFDDAVDKDEPKQQPVLCYGAVTSDLPTTSKQTVVPRRRTSIPAAKSSKPQHVFYPTDQKPHSKARLVVARAPAKRQMAQMAAQRFHENTQGLNQPDQGHRRAHDIGSRHCAACDEVAAGGRPFSVHSQHCKHGHAHQRSTGVASRATTASHVRSLETQAQRQAQEQQADVQHRRQRALANVHSGCERGQTNMQPAGSSRPRTQQRSVQPTQHDRGLYVDDMFCAGDDSCSTGTCDTSGEDVSDFETLSDPGAQDFSSGATKSALSRPVQHHTATGAMAARLQFSQGVSPQRRGPQGRIAGRTTHGNTAGKHPKQVQVHWDDTEAAAAASAHAAPAPQQRVRVRHGLAQECPSDVHADPDIKTSKDTPDQTPYGAQVHATHAVQPSEADQAAGSARQPASPTTKPRTQQQGAETDSQPANATFEGTMAIIGKTYFESCAPLKVSSVHQIARLSSTEALVGVLALADYLALGGQVGAAKLSIPAPRDVGPSAQADMFSLGVLQECLMGRQGGARGIWSTAAAALTHGAATARGTESGSSHDVGPENVLAGLGGEGLLKSTSAWNSIRSQVAILISRCEEYCLQGHLRRKWAIMWDALYQRLLMFVAWQLARTVEAFSFVASAPLQPGVGRQETGAPPVQSATGRHNTSDAYGWEHGRNTKQSKPMRSPGAIARAASTVEKLAPPQWLRCASDSSPEPVAAAAQTDDMAADSVVTVGSRGASTTADVLGSSFGTANSQADHVSPVSHDAAPAATVPCLDPPLGNVLGGAADGKETRGSQRASLLYGRLASFVIAFSHGSMGDAQRLLMVMQQLKTTFRAKAKAVDAVQASLGPEAAERYLKDPDQGMPAGVQHTSVPSDSSNCCPSAADVRFILGEVVSLWHPDSAAAGTSTQSRVDHLLLLQERGSDMQRLQRTARGAQAEVKDGPTLQPVRFWQLVTHPIPSLQAVLGLSSQSSQSTPPHGGEAARAQSSARGLPDGRSRLGDDERSVRHLLQQVHEASATARPWRDVKMSALAAVLPSIRRPGEGDADDATAQGHTGPLESSLAAATANRHARKLPQDTSNDNSTSRSGHMLADFSSLLLHLLDCMLLGRAAAAALGGGGMPVPRSRTAPSPGFNLQPHRQGGLDLSAGGQQRLVFDLHVAEAMLQLSLYVEFAAWFNSQEK